MARPLRRSASPLDGWHTNFNRSYFAVDEGGMFALGRVRGTVSAKQAPSSHMPLASTALHALVS